MKGLWRIIDANLNRSREGLRVCEEIARFVLEDSKLSRGFKDLRHRISRSIKRLPAGQQTLLRSRDSQADVGRNVSSAASRKNYKDVFSANIQRTKESLRVLEEFSSIVNHPLSKVFARLRFKLYELEKKTIARL
jgi:thiamine-phosphate pyrophosphorylase